MAIDTDVEIDRFSKSAGETIIIKRRADNGQDLVDIRAYYRAESQNGDGEELIRRATEAYRKRHQRRQ